jgi:hypothetical protein
MSRNWLKLKCHFHNKFSRCMNVLSFQRKMLKSNTTALQMIRGILFNNDDCKCFYHFLLLSTVCLAFNKLFLPPLLLIKSIMIGLIRFTQQKTVAFSVILYFNEYSNFVWFCQIGLNHSIACSLAILRHISMSNYERKHDYIS